MFQKTIIAKYLKTQDKAILASQWNLFQKHFHDTATQDNIRSAKEEQYQEGFLRDLFVQVFGYTLNPTSGFNLTTEYRNIKDSKKADGAIIIEDKVLAVIELKGTNTTDLGKIEDQAFNYKNNQTGCTYVITANFEKLRLYIDDSVRFMEFNLFKLTQEDFNLLYLLLSFENIKNNIPKQMKAESLNQEDIVTKKLYKDYSVFKRELFQNLTKLNPDLDPLLLFQKSQKLLDRILFLLFGEDRGLLPPNSVRQILEQWDKLKELDAYDPLYSRYKKYFGYLNTGFKGKQHDVFAYNGGLFKEDEILDQIKIDDDILYKHTFLLSQYDFASEVDVNILGHIFENSLNEIDEIKAQLAGEEIDKSKTKRKKDGVFYTPKYITKYIVENTVGKLCEEKKAELNIVEEDYFTDKKRLAKTLKTLLVKLDDYRSWLLQVTIVDPACGSGAFLNEALNFLIEEHQYIDELEAKLRNVPIIFSYHSESILEHNLFGVDLNEESVEIAKLSLWLRTAEPNRKLNSLNDNIKCGNSLIDDVAVAGDKAFNWEKEFPQVFEKGGFDVVIGNPPWGAKLDPLSIKYLVSNYPVVPTKIKDTYLYFILFSIKILKIDSGLLGLIVPNTWLLINNASLVREYLLGWDIKQIIDHGDDVFSDAIVESLTLIVKKSKDGDGNVLTIKQRSGRELINHQINKAMWLNDELNRITVELIASNYSLIKKFESISQPFSFSSEIIFGIKPYQVGYGSPVQTRKMVDDRIYHSKSKIGDRWRPLVTGSDVSKYHLDFENEFIEYGNNLMYASNEEKIKSKKILLRRTSHDLKAVIDTHNYYPQNSLFIITSTYNLEYLGCLLNSKLFDFIYKSKCPQVGKVFAEVKPSIIKSLPIIDISSELQHPFIEKSNSMISLNKELQESTIKIQRNLQREFSLQTPSKKLQNWYELSYDEFLKELKKQKVELSLAQKADWETYFDAEKSKAQEIQYQIDKTDKEIDAMVYELYGLTEEEIAIVEQG